MSQGFVANIEQGGVDKVDVLFMIDNSGSMSQEQQSIVDQMPRLARILATGDRDLDGMSDFTPVKDLHLGVVTSDMGVAGFGGIPTCGPGTTAGGAMFGDDGILRTQGHTATTGCMATYPNVLSFIPADHPDLETDAAQFGADFGCVAQTGTSGCGFEQQLESPLKALTPSTNAAIQFFGPTLGHGDRENAGFLRDDSVIAIVLVTDEEDCSVDSAKIDVFNQSSMVYTGDLNLRCFNYPDVAYPVQRYIDGFRALRPGRENLVVFAAITGVPTALVADPNNIDYDAILAAPEMVEMVRTDGSMAGHQLRPSCTAPAGRGEAFPPRRIVEVAAGLAPNAIVQSICQSDYGPALDAIISKIADALSRVCLPRQLNPDAEGLVGCDVLEKLPAEGSGSSTPSNCAAITGVDPTPVRIESDGRQVCRVNQLAVLGDNNVADGEGWYYDDFSPDVLSKCTSYGSPQRIAFTTQAVPLTGVEVNLECLQRVQSQGTGGTGGPIDVGTFCDPAASDVCAGSTIPNLFCEGSTRTCQIRCDTDEACPTSFRCQPAADPTQNFCVNPICI
ncbi:MAG: hypothetical protein IPK60_09830 [Sandaracinaceae bacterium]|nr:hypothetical protein [Sandaracinaceae bacterium]